MDAKQSQGTAERERVMELAKCMSKIANSDVSVQPPTGNGPDRVWILEAHGAGRIRFEPGAEIANLLTVVSPPKRRNRKSGNGAVGGKQSTKRGAGVPS